VALGQFYLRVLRSSPVSTSAPTLRTRLPLGSCQKATFCRMLKNTGEKVLSLSSEKVYYTNSHVRRVSAWCGTAVSFDLLSYMKCTGQVDRQTATALQCCSLHGVCICRGLVPNITTGDVMSDIFHCPLSDALSLFDISGLPGIWLILLPC
jgi:hypothetical protein